MNSKLLEVLDLNGVRLRKQMLKSYRNSQVIDQEFSEDDLDAF
jgi:hypothetical protein